MVMYCNFTMPYICMVIVVVIDVVINGFVLMTIDQDFWHL